MNDEMYEYVKKRRAEKSMSLFKKAESDLTLEERRQIDQEAPGWGLSRTLFSLVPLVEVSMGGTRVRDPFTKREYKIYMPMNGGKHSYPFVILVNKKRNQAYKAAVHQFVANAFIEKVDGKECVNHLDSDPWNNSYTNLEWCTQSENVKYALASGRIKTGQQASTSVYSDAQIHHVCQLLQDRPDMTTPAISEITGVSIPTIENIYLGIARRDISSKYKFPEKEYLSGENHWNSVYSDEQVHAVCRLLSDPKYATYTFEEIGQIVGVDKQTVGDIYRKQTRLDIVSQYEFCDRLTLAKGEKNGNSYYSDDTAEQVCCILDDKIQGKNKWSQEEIGRLTHTSRSFVCDVWNGRERVNIAQVHIFYQQRFGKKEEAL